MTTIDKIALAEFNMTYDQLGEKEKQWCNDEMVNNAYKYGLSWINDHDKHLRDPNHKTII